MPVAKSSATVRSEKARRSGWTRARVFCVMRSSWSCSDVLGELLSEAATALLSQFSRPLRSRDMGVRYMVADIADSPWQDDAGDDD